MSDQNPIKNNPPTSPANNGVSRRTFLKWTAAGAAATMLPATQAVRAAPRRQATQTLRVVLFGAPDRAKTFDYLGQGFAAANPGIKVEFLGVPGAEWDEFFGKVSTMLAGGQNIDLIEVGTEGLQLFASKKFIQPLDARVQADKSFWQEYFDDVAPQLVEAMMYDGKLFNMPFLWGPAVMFYHKGLFKQAGLEAPKPDWTKDDFLKAARAVHKLGDDVYGFGWPNRHWGGLIPWVFAQDSNILKQTQFDGGDWLWKTFYASNKGAEGRKGGVRWPESMANDPRNVEALQFLQDLTWKDKAAPAPADFGQLANFFSNGKLAMLPAHRFMVGRLIGAGMKKDDFDVTFMPKWATQRHQFGTSGLAITSNTKLADQAYQMIKHLTRKEQMGQYVKGGVHTSTRRSVANDPAQAEGIGPSNRTVFYDALDKFPGSAPIPAPPPNRDFTAAFVKYVGLAMANEMTPKDALDKMHAELSAILAK